jgi:hypothetical protein
VTIGRSAPLAEAGWAQDTHDFRFCKSEIFFARRVDTISENQPVGQITLASGRAARFPKVAIVLPTPGLPARIAIPKGGEALTEFWNRARTWAVSPD